MRKLFYLSLSTISLIFAAQEPSAFNAGGLEPKKSETQILNEKFFNLSTQVKHIEESQEGLKSIFEGQVQRVQDVSSKIELLKGENNATLSQMKSQVDSNFALQNDNIEKIKQSISALGALIKKTNAQMQEEINGLKAQITALETAQKANIEVKSKEAKSEAVKSNVKDSKKTDTNSEIAIVEVDSLLQELATPSQGLINAKENNETTSDKAITKEPKEESKKDSNKENKEAAQDSKKEEVKQQDTKQEVNKQSSKDESAQEKIEQKPKVNLENKPLSEVFKEGEEFFKNKKYEEANDYLQFAVKGNYKPARGNYLLGEVAFEQKRYEDAIYYYKTSATRYDKADYMPRLMLNSAKSFNAIKEPDNAKRFLETLISLYPKSNEAKEAKKLLK